jgi:hypothetical protein
MMPRIEIVSHAAVERKFLLTHLSHCLNVYNAFFGNKVLHGIEDCLWVIGDLIVNYRVLKGAASHFIAKTRHH